MSFQIKNNSQEFAKMVKDAQVKALREAGKVIIKQAKEFTPIDTGLLISSYGTSLNSKEIKLTVGNTAPYAGHVELGTKNTKANLMLTGAAEVKLQEVAEILRKSIDDSIKSYSDKGGQVGNLADELSSSDVGMTFGGDGV